MPKLSLRTLLASLIGFVTLAGFTVNLAILLANARPRILKEEEASLSLTRQIAVMATAGFQDAAEPDRMLALFFQSLGALRHVVVVVVGPDGVARPIPPQARNHDVLAAPDWFAALVRPAPKTLQIPVNVRGANFGKILVAASPFDEIEEIWVDVVRLAAVSMAVSIVLLVAALFILNWSLRPLEGLRHGLAALEAGESGVRAAFGGPAEFSVIAASLNSLAGTLECVTTSNRDLVAQLIDVQESERQDLARELHDEAGPCLFAIRAGVMELNGISARPQPEAGAVRDACAKVGRASESLQSLFRDVLGRLSPRGVVEFGLQQALGALVDFWRVHHPDVEVVLMCPHDLATLDEKLALTAYRIVQEALTNAFRHAGAERIEIRIALGWIETAGRLTETDAAPALLVTVEDNGVGLRSPSGRGRGVFGMKERTAHLGGRFAIEAGADGGLRVAAALPLADREGDGVVERSEAGNGAGTNPSDSIGNRLNS
ncbi:two-component system sensor histidine kinase UhpB [Rhodoblastus sphagnicola]|uniref:histidine kinase n=1 Tax=Rhodoblastus sphagnicola TaxID=333368 RepID=UPI001304D1A6|nr:histidine kinase [Rhodoblastus sphagnicola]MBB4200167.1 two-component system sensor histidine kinase UhpB [Rhodoblastus sphagnicola]